MDSSVMNKGEVGTVPLQVTGIANPQFYSLHIPLPVL